METIEMIDRTEDNRLRAQIQKIYWERINLILEIELQVVADTVCTDELAFYLVDSSGRARAHFHTEDCSENRIRLLLNVTNPGNCLCVPPGQYRLWACCGSEMLAAVEISTHAARTFSDNSRSFLYAKNTHCYSFSFSVEEVNHQLRPILIILDAQRVKIPLRSKLGETKNKLIHRLVIALYGLMHRWYRWKSGGKGKKTILLLSEQSSKPSATFRILRERMTQRGIDEQFHISFHSWNDKIWHQSIGKCLLSIWKIASADQIYIDDIVTLFSWFPKAKDTQLVQLYHAGAGYKSSGYSRWGEQKGPAPKGSHRQYDYGITPSAQIAHFFSEIFGINAEQILPTGMPRMDEFLSSEHREQKAAELINSYPAIQNKKVILFAPTYRGYGRSDAYYPYEMIDFDALYDFCGDEYVVWFKMHPWVSAPVPISPKHSDRFFDLSRYPNINDLFYVTDIFISDYSSNVYEFSFMDRPMLFFAFDEAEYAVVRGFHRDYRSSIPGKLCLSFEELLSALKNGDYELNKLEEYKKQHHPEIVDTGASDRVIDWFVLGNIPSAYLNSINAVREDFQRMETLRFPVIEE